ncbi:hypothetical protein ANN_02097 [Periplaneta americana]|uniref:Per a allergen n=1 Tax=Periplaneta americana TaxID=6978 RepID=A0ABQ8TWG9_PERAM|nr:hypothetical protein ANN_02097 [Periplaneta americana]
MNVALKRLDLNKKPLSSKDGGALLAARGESRDELVAGEVEHALLQQQQLLLITVDESSKVQTCVFRMSATRTYGLQNFGQFKHFYTDRTSHGDEVDLGGHVAGLHQARWTMQSRCGTPTSEREDREDHGSDGLTCLPERRETMVEDSKEQSFVERTGEGHCK